MEKLQLQQEIISEMIDVLAETVLHLSHMAGTEWVKTRFDKLASLKAQLKELPEVPSEKIPTTDELIELYLNSKPSDWWSFIMKSKDIDKEVPSNEICDLCGKAMQSRTRDAVEYLCMNPECDAYIKLQKDIDKAGEKQLPFICHICEDSFTYEEDLNAHIRDKH